MKKKAKFIFLYFPFLIRKSPPKNENSKSWITIAILSSWKLMMLLDSFGAWKAKKERLNFVESKCSKKSFNEFSSNNALMKIYRKASSAEEQFQWIQETNLSRRKCSFISIKMKLFISASNNGSRQKYDEHLMVWDNKQLLKHSWRFFKRLVYEYNVVVLSRRRQTWDGDGSAHRKIKGWWSIKKHYLCHLYFMMSALCLIKHS